MGEKNSALDNKINVIRNKLAHKDPFTVADLGPVLEEKKSTLYWTIWNLAQKGYIYKIGKGLYSLQKKEPDIQPILSPLGNRVLGILRESGYEFFISGLDILSIFMEHVPETYPVLLYGNRYSLDELSELLSKNDIAVVHRDTGKYQSMLQIPMLKDLALLYPTNEFSYAENSLASFEKALVDMYYEVTRQEYPLPLQELVRIFKNIKRRISLDTNKLVKIASRRSIHYDIRYIVERDFISDKAIEFVTLLKRQD
jgi:hypothetical protein